MAINDEYTGRINDKTKLHRTFANLTTTHGIEHATPNSQPLKMQKCNSSRINQNHRNRCAVYRAKKVKRKNTLKAKAAVGTVSTVHCTR